MSTNLTVILTTLALYSALTVSPGPNFALVSRLAVSGSRSAALGASFGIATASVIYAILSMTGLAVLLTEIGWLAGGVQIAGGCYLVYLGFNAWLDAGNAVAPHRLIGGRTFWYGLRTGFLVDLSNPKSITFVVGLYCIDPSQYGDMGKDDHCWRRIFDRGNLVWARCNSSVDASGACDLCPTGPMDRTFHWHTSHRLRTEVDLRPGLE